MALCKTFDVLNLNSVDTKIYFDSYFICGIERLLNGTINLNYSLVYFASIAKLLSRGHAINSSSTRLPSIIKCLSYTKYKHDITSHNQSLMIDVPMTANVKFDIHKTMHRQITPEFRVMQNFTARQ